MPTANCCASSARQDSGRLRKRRRNQGSLDAGFPADKIVFAGVEKAIGKSM